MKKSISLFVLIILCLTVFNCEIRSQKALSAEQVAQKVSTLISQSKGLSANFILKGNGRNGKGILKSAGTKFSVMLPGIGIWYNGKDLYTYNQKTSETTVVEPTARELLESNPLLYVKNGGAGYTYKFSPVKRNGKYVVELTPTSAKNDIKKMSFTINSSNFYPEKLIVTTRNGDLTIEIENFNPSASLADSEFEYPKAKYPKVEIVDLR